MSRRASWSSSTGISEIAGIERAWKWWRAVVAFYLHLAGTMEDQFLILHRHFPLQMAETNPVCRSHLESIYNCLLDIFEEGIRVGMQDGSVSVDSPRKTAMVCLPWWTASSDSTPTGCTMPAPLYDSLMGACRRLLTEPIDRHDQRIPALFAQPCSGTLLPFSGVAAGLRYPAFKSRSVCRP
jgi:hypothetical protein